MIGYYIHHSGHGHLARACSISAHLQQRVTALTSAVVTRPHPFDTVVPLPRDDTAPSVSNETAQGALHWAPVQDSGLAARMRTIVDWIATARPSAVVVDVSVEVATLIRLLGVPVIVVAMPGQRTDPPHDWVYRLADHILACWPRELYEPTWLKPHREKVSYIGGVSRFDGRDRSTARRGGSAGKRRVAVLGGAGGSALDLSSVRGCAADLPDYEWQALGVSTGTWVQDPWPDLCAADVVVAHAGESSVADLATAEKAAIIVPAPRPFDEQEITGALLARAGLAVVQPHWPLPVEWPDLLHRARSIDGKRWRRWRTAGASQRAAAAIEGVAARYSEGIGVR